MNNDVRGRNFAARGKTPVVMSVGGTRHKLSMNAGCINQDNARWMIVDGAFNHEKLIEFFGSLVKDSGKKIFLILNNLGVHHCKPVKAWLAENKAKMEVFYLPTFSPELNPEERLNANLQHFIRERMLVRTKPKLQVVATYSMNTSANSPECVKAYFQDAFVKYAAK